MRWQDVVDWLMGSVQTKAPRSPEEQGKYLEKIVEALEAKATRMEHEAELRKKIADANARIKEVTPPSRRLRWLVLGVGVLLLFLMVKSCF